MAFMLVILHFDAGDADVGCGKMSSAGWCPNTVRALRKQRTQEAMDKLRMQPFFGIKGENKMTYMDDAHYYPERGLAIAVRICLFVVFCVAVLMLTGCDGVNTGWHHWTPEEQGEHAKRCEA